MVNSVASQQEGPGFESTCPRLHQECPGFAEFGVFSPCLAGALFSSHNQNMHMRHSRSGWPDFPALSHRSSGLTLHSNLPISLYNSLFNDNEAALSLPLPKK